MHSFVKYGFFVAFSIIAGYMLYDAFQGPEAVVVGHGKVIAKSEYSKKSVERPTRQLKRGSVKYWELRPPKACGSIAPRTVRRLAAVRCSITGRRAVRKMAGTGVKNCLVFLIAELSLECRHSCDGPSLHSHLEPRSLYLCALQVQQYHPV
jgi:hypothetical protein